ncbi:MAG: gephyrin-like molybdotransferase Glp [Gemmatimonadota bacterium]
MSAPPRLADAIAQVTAAGTLRPPEPAPLADALGRVLAVDVVAPRSIPPWPNAGMDGYAVRAADVRGATPEAPVTLRVTATVAAGAMPACGVAAGEAVRIFTGAPVPAGADSVVRWEDTDRGRAVVQVRRDRDAHQHVRAAGEDATAGAVALPAGTVVTPGVVQYLASLGLATIPVARRPVVALVRSGDDLVPLDRAAHAGPAQIVDSNAVALAAIVREAGATCLDLGIVPDDEASLAVALSRAAREADVVVSAGGVAAGDFDFAKGAAARAGGSVTFWKMAARPGSQLAFGEVRGVPWLGLPGNPASATVCGELLLRPLLRAMAGDRAPHRPTHAAPAGEPFVRDPRVALLARVRLVAAADGTAELVRSGPQASHLVRPLALADGVACVAPGDAPLTAGTPLPYVRFADHAGAARVPFGDAAT